MRLDKLLAEAGEGTRSEVKILIKKGKVTVNGAVAKDSGMKVDPAFDLVAIGGRTITYEKFRYFMLNKPAGCVSATRDGLSATVIELLDGENPKGLFPVGRLDKDTEGLLLITNDGQLGHDLTSPKKHVDKKYIAFVSRALSAAELQQFAAGVDIGDEQPTLPAEIEAVECSALETLPAEICELESGDEALEWCSALPDWCAAHSDQCSARAAYLVTLREGRYHQVKRMFEAFDSKVLYLKRISMGALELDPDLAPGEYRRLRPDEIELLR